MENRVDGNGAQKHRIVIRLIYLSLLLTKRGSINGGLWAATTLFRSQSLSRVTNLLKSTHIIEKVIGKGRSTTNFTFERMSECGIIPNCSKAGKGGIYLQEGRSRQSRELLQAHSYYLLLLSLGKIFEVIIKRQNWWTTWRKR